MASSGSRGVALFVNSDGTNCVRRDIERPEPGTEEIQIEVFYSGSNPADIDHAAIGINSTIMGYDFMGRVSKVGGTSKYKVGDLVAGQAPIGVGRPMKYGAHQPYLVALEDHIFPVPENLPHAHAAALSVITMTAADVLYNFFDLPFPGIEASTNQNKGPLLIWGASTSVGLAMVQLARASGIRSILVTASPKRHEMLRGFGASHCFDYSDRDVVSKIKGSLDDAKIGPLVHAVDCTGTPEAADNVALIASDDAILLSLRGQRDKRFKMPFANKAREVTLQVPGLGRIVVPAQPQQQARIYRGLEWAAQNYGMGFSLPVVNVFEGTAEDALEEVRLVPKGARFGKLVLKHPLI